MKLTIISGGEPGASEAALAAAKAQGVPVAGCCPPSGKNSAFQPVSLWYGLTPVAGKFSYEPDARACTSWNLRRATHLLVLHTGELPGCKDVIDPKSIWAQFGLLGAVAWNTALEYRTPRRAVNITDPKEIMKLRSWLGDEAQLMIAGPNERECPGIHLQVLNLLRAFFKILCPSADPAPVSAPAVGKPRAQSA